MNKLIHGDCLEVMPQLIDEGVKVDMILADVPYGTTQCKWDSIIDLEEMWKLADQISEENAAKVFTASQPFTTTLISSNIDNFKYCWVWEKPAAKGHFNAKKRPMVAHEDIAVFYHSQPTYNPIKTYGHVRKSATKEKSLNSEVYNNNTKTVSYDSTERYPRSVQVFKQDTQKSSLHPTQKPVVLMEYLIKTYTNEGDTVLDFTMGSGTTCLAAKNLNRQYIGIEKEQEYYDIAIERLQGTCK